MAQAYNLRIANGAGWPIFNMHTMAGLMNGWLVEFHWGMWQAGQKFFKAPRAREGQGQDPRRPGLGFTPEYDALAECRVKDPAGLKAAACRPTRAGSSRSNGRVELLRPTGPRRKPGALFCGRVHKRVAGFCHNRLLCARASGKRKEMV